MPRTALALQEIGSGGVQPTLAAANVDGHSVQNHPDGRVYVEVLNGSGSPITVTVQTVMEREGLALPDKAVSVPAGERRKIGVWRQAIYEQADGTVYVDFSSVTSVTVGAFRLGSL